MYLTFVVSPRPEKTIDRRFGRAQPARANLLRRSALNCVSEEIRAIPNENTDPEQNDRDKRIDLQYVVRQLGRDRTGEVARCQNKPEFHRGWRSEEHTSELQSRFGIS